MIFRSMKKKKIFIKHLDLVWENSVRFQKIFKNWKILQIPKPFIDSAQIL